jgi:hypothetical protein
MSTIVDRRDWMRHGFCDRTKLFTHTLVDFTLQRSSKQELMSTWWTRLRTNASFYIPGTIFEDGQWSGSKVSRSTCVNSGTASHTKQCPRLRTGPAVSLLVTSQAISSSTFSLNLWSSKSCRVRRWWTRQENTTWWRRHHARVHLRNPALWLQGAVLQLELISAILPTSILDHHP